jgi:hypothetical protein
MPQKRSGVASFFDSDVKPLVATGGVLGDGAAQTFQGKEDSWYEKYKANYENKGWAIAQLIHITEVYTEKGHEITHKQLEAQIQNSLGLASLYFNETSKYVSKKGGSLGYILNTIEAQKKMIKRARQEENEGLRERKETYKARRLEVRNWPVPLDVDLKITRQKILAAYAEHGGSMEELPEAPEKGTHSVGLGEQKKTIEGYISEEALKWLFKAKHAIMLLAKNIAKKESKGNDAAHNFWWDSVMGEWHIRVFEKFKQIKAMLKDLHAAQRKQDKKKKQAENREKKASAEPGAPRRGGGRRPEQDGEEGGAPGPAPGANAGKRGKNRSKSRTRPVKPEDSGAPAGQGPKKGPSAPPPPRGAPAGRGRMHQSRPMRAL